VITWRPERGLTLFQENLRRSQAREISVHAQRCGQMPILSTEDSRSAALVCPLMTVEMMTTGSQALFALAAAVTAVNTLSCSGPLSTGLPALRPVYGRWHSYHRPLRTA